MLFQPLARACVLSLAIVGAGHGAASTGNLFQPYLGQYEGSYEKGWLWSTRQQFRFALQQPGKERYGEMTLEHPSLGPCKGSYVVGHSKEDRNESLVVYSSNLSCQNDSFAYFVFQVILPSLRELKAKEPFLAQVYLRSTRDNSLKIQEEATLKRVDKILSSTATP